MSKRSRTLLLSAVALVALVGILLALLFLLPESPTDDDNKPLDTSVVLIDKTTDAKVSVTAAEVVLKNESYKIATTEENKIFYIEGYEALPLDFYSLNELGKTLLSVTASKKVVDSAENLSDFGFATDGGCYAKINVSYSDKTSFAFEVGNLSPNGEEYYCRPKDSKTIYLLDSSFVETAAAPPTSYLSRALFTAPDAENETDQVAVKSVTLGGSVRKDVISFYNNGRENAGNDNVVLSGFYLTKPYSHAVNSKTPLISVGTFSSAMASGVAKIFPSAADLKNYGLANPYSRCVVELSIQRTTVSGVGDDKTTTISFHNTFENTLLLGNKNEAGDYYALAIVEGEVTPLVYTVSPESVPWAETQYDEIADPLLFFEYIYNLDGMDITVDGNTHNFHFAHDAEAEDTDKKLIVTAGGKQYNTPDFRTLYTWLISIYRNGSVDKAPNTEPLLTFTIRPLDKTKKPQTIRLYTYSAGKCVAQHETGEVFLVDAKNVNLFVSNYRHYIKGEAIIP